MWLAPMREGVFRREGIEKERGAKRGFMFFCVCGFELLYGTVVKENESISVMTQCARMMKKKKEKKMIKIRRTRRGGKW